MKLIRNHLFRTFLCLAAVVATQACSKSGIDDKLAQIASDDADFVAVGDISRTLSALEIQVKDGALVLPDYFTDFVSTGLVSKRELSEMEEYSEMDYGIDFTNTVVVVKNIDNVSSYGNPRPDAVFSFDISDIDKFSSFMEDIDNDITTDEINGYTVVGDKHASIVVKDKQAYMIFKKGRPLAEDDAIEGLEKWIEKAKEKPLSDWKREYLSRPAVASAIFSLARVAPYLDLTSQGRDARRELEANLGVSVADVTVAASFDLAGPSAKLNVSLLDKKGAVIPNAFGGSFNTDLLRYTTDTDIAVAAVAVSPKGLSEIINAADNQFNQQISYYRSEINDDYYGYYSEYYYHALNQAQQMKSLFDGVANALDGNAMMALGYNPLEISSLKDFKNSDPSKFTHAVVAAKCKSGRGREVYETVCTLLSEAAADSRGANDSTAVTLSVPSGNSFKVDFYQADYSNYSYYSDYYNGPQYKVAFSVYAELDGDNVVISNLPVSRQGGSHFNTEFLAGKSAALQIDIPASNPLIASYDLPCGFQASVSAEGLSWDADITLTDTGQNIIPAIFKILTASLKAIM